MSSNQPMKLPHEVPPEAAAFLSGEDDGEVFDPSTNPEALALAQQMVAAANDAPEDVLEGVPTLPVPNRNALKVDLPVGIFNPLTRTLVKVAEVRELNGEDEEYYSKGTTFHDRKARLIERGTVKLGDEEPEKSVLAALSQGDHEVLLLAIRRATYGDTLELELTCPRRGCGLEQEVEINLSSDIEVRSYESIQAKVTLKSGTEVSFHWPTASDERAVWEFAEKNPQATVSEMNTKMIAKVLESIDGSPSFGERSALSMGMRDRREFVDHLAANTPGPDYRGLTHECKGCGFEAPLEVSFADLFR